MRALLLHFSLRHLRKHPLRAILGLLSVALGTALYVSVDVSNTSATEAFRATVRRLAGNAHLQVVRGRVLGIEEEALAKVEAVPGVKAAPVLQVAATAPGTGETGLLVLGLDFRREAGFGRWPTRDTGLPPINPVAFLVGDPVLVAKSLADRRGLKPGSRFSIDTPTGRRVAMVAGVLPDEGAAQAFGGGVAVVPIASAQRWFRREGRFDRIEVRVEGDVDQAAARLREALGPGFLVRPPPSENSLLSEAVTRMEALLGISVIALLVAVFIIYNSVSLSVVERVREIGTLRAIGATRGQIFTAVLLEWGAVGLAGAGTGLALGVSLARALLRMTAQEVNQVAMVVDVTSVAIHPRTPVLGLGLGALTAVAAAYFPARQAMSVSPVAMMRQGMLTMGATAGYRRSFVAGLAAILATAAATAGWMRLPGGGLTSSFLGFLGAALVLPQAAFWASRGMRPVLAKLFRVEGLLAADNLGKHPRRTALTVIALAGALSMMVAASSVILGFRVRGERWLEEALPFDVTVNAVDYAGSLYSGASLPPEGVAEVRAMEVVDYTYGVRSALQDYGERDVMIFAIECEGYERMHRLRGTQGFLKPGTRAALEAGHGVVVSDNFAALTGKRPGDELELSTLQGPRRFRVMATYEDYTWPQGSVYMDRAVYRRLWDDDAISYLDVKLKPGIPVTEARRAILDRVAKFGTLFVYDVKKLKEVADETLDRTLRLTNVQVAVASLIGFLGIVNSLLISVMTRTREIGLLRAAGMTRGQVAKMMVLESLFLAILGGVLGVALGLAGAMGPLAQHVAEISGYAMPLTIPWATVALALVGALVIGVVASILPARRAARLDVLDSLLYE